MRDEPIYCRGRQEVLTLDSVDLYGQSGIKSRVFGMLGPRLGHFRNACDSISKILLEAYHPRANSRTMSTLELISGSRLAMQEMEDEILGMVFHDETRPQYTTEIRLSKTGLDDEGQWAHVAPKSGCILLTMRGCQKRSSWSLPVQDDRTWIVFKIQKSILST